MLSNSIMLTNEHIAQLRKEILEDIPHFLGESLGTKTPGMEAWSHGGILETTYPIPGWMCIEPLRIEKSEMNDTLPRIENWRRGKVKGEKRKKRKTFKSFKSSKRPKTSNRFVIRKKRKAIQTSKLFVQTFEKYRYRLIKCFRDDICNFFSPEPGREVLHRLTHDTTGAYVDVELKDRGE